MLNEGKAIKKPFTRRRSWSSTVNKPVKTRLMINQHTALIPPESSYALRPSTTIHWAIDIHRPEVFLWKQPHLNQRSTHKQFDKNHGETPKNTVSIAESKETPQNLKQPLLQSSPALAPVSYITTLIHETELSFSEPRMAVSTPGSWGWLDTGYLCRSKKLVNTWCTGR